MSTKRTYTAQHEGITVTCTSKRSYSHAVLVKNPSCDTQWARDEAGRPWMAISWCGRLDLAVKQADTWRTMYHDVVIVELVG